MTKDFSFYKPFAFAICILMMGCSGKNPSSKNVNQNFTKTDSVPVVFHKPPSSFNDTITISSKSAIFYNPDSLQLEKIKKITSQNGFESSIHDCFYQMRNARIILKKYWPQIKIIESVKARYLLFIKTDNTRTYIDLNSLGDICGIFLFDGKKDPQLIDMMNVDTALEYYFNNK